MQFSRFWTWLRSLLAGHHHAGGLVDQTHGGGGLVDVLAAGAGGAEHLHLDLFRPDLHGLVVLDVGHDLHGGKGGLPPAGGVKGGDPHQAVDAVLALEVAVGVLALDRDGGGLDARLLSALIVQGLIGEVVALGPAGIHAVEHGGPVLGLGAAGAGVDGQNGVVGVILARQQRGQPALLHLFFQCSVGLLQLRQQLRVVGLLPHLAQHRGVLPVLAELVKGVDLVLQPLDLLGHLLGGGQVVPESLLLRLGLEVLELGPGPVHVQSGGQLIQFGAHGGQLLLIFVVFDHSHSVLSVI